MAAGQAPELITEHTAPPDMARIINELRIEVFQLKTGLTTANQQISQMSQHQQQQAAQMQAGSGGNDKELTRWRSMQSLPRYNGEEKHFKDFSFKIHQFVRQVNGFEKFLKWVSEMDSEPVHNDMEIFKQRTGYPLEYFNDQLYGILSMITEGAALQIVMNVSENYDLRGAQAWYRMTRESAGKTGARLKRLADAVHRPKSIDSYSEAKAQLTSWDTNLKELSKIESQDLSDLTKTTILIHMVPIDLSRAIEADKALKTFEEIWAYVMEQIEVRKHWAKNPKKKDPNGMDLDAAEAEEPAPKDYEEPGCHPCSEGDLDTLKGAGKGQFQGYCGYCNIWGHKRVDCRKRQADIAKYGKGADGKGKPGGKDAQKGQSAPWQNSGKGQWQGGWQTKGKGKNNEKGKGKGYPGSLYNIDGESWGGSWGGSWGSSGISGGFFGCLTAESDSEDADIFLMDTENCERGAEPELMEKTISQNLESCPLSTAPKLQDFQTLREYWEFYRQRKENTPGEIGGGKFREKVKTTYCRDESMLRTPSVSTALSTPSPMSISLSMTSPMGSGRVDRGVQAEPYFSPVTVKDTSVQCTLIEDLGPKVYFSDRVDFHYDKYGKLYFVIKYVEDIEAEDFAMDKATVTMEQLGSNGNGLPLLTMPGPESTFINEQAQGQTPKAKTQSATGRRARWRHKKNLSKLNLATGEIETSDHSGSEAVQEVVDPEIDLPQSVVDDDEPNVNVFEEYDQHFAVPKSWMDGDVEVYPQEERRLCMWEEEPSGDLLGFNWRSEPQTYENKRWVKVDSVMDSGADAPVAPPSMLPNVKIEPSPGSIRGQNWVSASKHRLKNLGQQKIKACTEEGEETEVLFQIADVSKPLVSVASICERGNRVLFGKVGGVVQNLRTGREIPFYRRNGIYILTMWLQDGDEPEQPFARP